jgi:hypothetical protein
MEELMKHRNWLAIAGFIFVAAWLIGLAIEFDSPGPNASAQIIQDYYLAHQSTHRIQTYLIDGIAGIALIAFASALQTAIQKKGMGETGFSGMVFGFGVAAGCISLFQAACGETLANPVFLAGNADSVNGIFVLLNQADTFKMLAMALMIGTTSTVTLREQSLPRWLAGVGVLLSLSLIFGGLSFVLSSPMLYTVLFVGLPLLLIWVAGASIVLLRQGIENNGARSVMHSNQTPNRQTMS